MFTRRIVSAAAGGLRALAAPLAQARQVFGIGSAGSAGTCHPVGGMIANAPPAPQPGPLAGAQRAGQPHRAWRLRRWRTPIRTPIRTF